VANAADCVDQPRLTSLLGLAPQVADIDLEGVRGGRKVVPPYLLQDPLPGQHLAWVPQQQFEQRELGAGQPDLAIAAVHLAGGRVERQVGQRQGSGLVSARGRTAQQRAQPREQLLEGERLREVVVRARVQTGDPVGDLAPRGEHEHRDVVTDRPQPAARREAVHVRHHYVQYDRVRARRGYRAERLLAVGGQLDVVAVEGERTSQRFADGGIVVDDEHVHRLSLPHLAVRTYPGEEGESAGSSSRKVRTGPGPVCAVSKRTVTRPSPAPQTHPGPWSRWCTSMPGVQRRVACTRSDGSGAVASSGFA